MIRVSIVAASVTGCAELEDLIRGDPRFTITGRGTSIAGWGLPSRGHPPDVLLVESSDGDGLPALPRFGDVPPIVLLTGELSRAQIRAALYRGAHALLPRQSSRQEVAAALVAAAAGLTALGPEQMDVLLPSPSRFESQDTIVEPLTARELEVLALLAEGAANKDIAQRLALSEHTVKFHVSSILGKLGAASRTEAVREGIRRGLVLL